MAARGNTAAALGAWIVFEDEAGFSMTPLRGVRQVLAAGVEERALGCDAGRLQSFRADLLPIGRCHRRCCLLDTGCC
ncbi:hypothetical protein ABZ788_40225 [Streptomyces tendae]